MRFGRTSSSVLFIITIFLLLLMCFSGFYSFYVTNSVSGDAMIINRLGVIRGSIQRIVKLELAHKNSEKLISKVDIEMNAFISQQIPLYDHTNEVINSINHVQNSWISLKDAIVHFRKEGSLQNEKQLLEASEEIWYEANNMVSISEDSSEAKMKKYYRSYFALFLNIVLSFLIIFLIKRYVKDSLEYHVNYDSLTGAFNRRYYSSFMNRELARADRYHKVFSLILFDIDFFKKVNDQYGHSIGDQVLIELAKITRQCIRKSDVFARVGGEEFVIISPETGFRDALKLAEKLRIQVAGTRFCEGLHVTISLGITEYLAGDDESAIYKRADEGLYAAKSNGRNRSEIK